MGKRADQSAADLAATAQGGDWRAKRDTVRPLRGPREPEVLLEEMGDTGTPWTAERDAATLAGELPFAGAKAAAVVSRRAAATGKPKVRN